MNKNLLRILVWLVLALSGLPALLMASEPLSIGIYTSDERSFTTASYWLEGKDGVVLIDTQFLLSEAEKFIAAAERATGKKVVMAFVLHPNPDKFNGIEVLQKRGIKVVTSRQVKALIPEVHQIRLDWFYSQYQPEYPLETPSPESFGDKTREFNVAGMKLTAHVLGPGCSAAHIVVQTGQRLFVGDLVSNRAHAWLELGLIDEWVARLNQLKALNPSKIYPGRGEVAGPGLLDEQIGYLMRVHSYIAAENPKGELGLIRKWLLRFKITRSFPEYRYPTFMSDGLPAVWKRVASERTEVRPLR